MTYCHDVHLQAVFILVCNLFFCMYGRTSIPSAFSNSYSYPNDSTMIETARL